MIRTRVIPCLLLSGQGLVKTEKFKNPRYIGDPLNAVKIFNEKECHELVFLDITATHEQRRPRFDYIQKIAGECFMPLAYGGGIRSIEDIQIVLQLGVEKVILNTIAAENPKFVQEAAETFGSQSIVVSIDVRKNMWGRQEVFVRNGQQNIKKTPPEYALEMLRLGAGELIVNSIDREGTMTGYDLELIRSVSSVVNIPVVALGGAGKIEDFGAAIRDGHASAIAAGSMFVYYGKLRGVLINFPSDQELLTVLT